MQVACKSRKFSTITPQICCHHRRKDETKSTALVKLLASRLSETGSCITFFLRACFALTQKNLKFTKLCQKFMSQAFYFFWQRKETGKFSVRKTRVKLFAELGFRATFLFLDVLLCQIEAFVSSIAAAAVLPWREKKVCCANATVPTKAAPDLAFS
jgi:hypothetical protein